MSEERLFVLMRLLHSLFRDLLVRVAALESDRWAHLERTPLISNAQARLKNASDLRDEAESQLRYHLYISQMDDESSKVLPKVRGLVPLCRRALHRPISLSARRTTLIDRHGADGPGRM